MTLSGMNVEESVEAMIIAVYAEEHICCRFIVDHVTVGLRQGFGLQRESLAKKILS